MKQYPLPENWYWIPFSNICLIISRGRSPKYGKGTAYAIKSAHVYPDGIRWHEAPTVTDQFAEKYEAIFALKEDDVLLNGTGRGTAGRSALVRESIEAVYIPDSHVNLIRTMQRRCLGAYLFYWLQTAYANKQIELNTLGSTNQTELSATKVKDFHLPLPPLPVQHTIVSILDQADSIRRKRNEASNLADQLSNATFVEMLGHPANNPKKWPLTALGAFLTQVRRAVTTEVDDEYAQITVRWYGKGAKVREHGLGSERRTKRQYLVKKGDFIYSRIDARKGAFAIASDDVDGCIVTSDFPLFEIDENLVLPRFLESFSRMPYFWELCAQNSEGTTNRARLKEDKLLRIRIPLPPLDEQFYFIQANDHLLATLGKQTNGEDASDALMATLLNRAFSGELTAEWEAVHAELIAAEVARLERRPQLALLSLVAQRQARRPEPVGVTSLMKYAFLAQQEGAVLHQPASHLYDFVPYHFGPFAKEVYADLEALEAAGWLTIHRASDDDPDAPERLEISLSPERTEAVETAVAELSAAEQADLSEVIATYGDLAHNELLNVVYANHPAYARRSRWRKR